MKSNSLQVSRILTLWRRVSRSTTTNERNGLMRRILVWTGKTRQLLHWVYMTIRRNEENTKCRCEGRSQPQPWWVDSHSLKVHQCWSIDWIEIDSEKVSSWRKAEILKRYRRGGIYIKWQFIELRKSEEIIRLSKFHY